MHDYHNTCMSEFLVLLFPRCQYFCRLRARILRDLELKRVTYGNFECLSCSVLVY